MKAELRSDEECIWVHIKVGDQHALLPIRLDGHNGIVREVLEAAHIELETAKRVLLLEEGDPDLKDGSVAGVVISGGDRAWRERVKEAVLGL